MSKLFKRFIAYTIDMMVIIIITQSLSGIPFLNKQLDTYNKHYDTYLENLNTYTEFKTDLLNSYKDEKLSEKEYDKLVSEHEEYKDYLISSYEDKKLSKKEYDKINKEIDKEYQDEYQKIYYKIEKNSVCYFIIYLVTTMVYFIGFNKLTNGQTLGKKLTRLRIVNVKDSNEDVSFWSYLIRMLILYQPIYYVAKLIGVFTLNMNEYNTLTTIFSEIQYYLEILIIIMIMIRLDGRGLHDILAKTRVIALDRNGQEKEDMYTSIVNKKLETIKDKKNKIIDEPVDK